MRLITRDDTALTAALIASAVIIFRQPLHYGLAVVQDVESRFHLDLLPALLLLLMSFGFHQYRKWVEARAQVRAAESDAAQARAQSKTLQQLMAFSHALTAALDRPSLQQVLWTHVPPFAPDARFWLLIRIGDRWETMLQDRTDSRSPEALERIADRALQPAAASGGDASLAASSDICMPLLAADTVVGVLGITVAAPLRPEQRSALEAVAAVLAIGIRNMQLFLEARELSLLDGLTGCFNRRHALQTLDAELRRVRRTGTPLSIVMFDLDHFKVVNDRYGHLRGDELLASVGATLGQVTRSSDVRCRYGGDEFLVILPDTPIAGAQQVAEGIRTDIAKLRIARDESIAATISVGVAAAQPGELDATALIARADAALYRAKASRNRVCVSHVASALTPDIDSPMDDVLPAEQRAAGIAEAAATPWIG